MIEKLKQFDTDIFLYLNSFHNSFFDPIMYFASNKFFWLPLIILLAILLIREYGKKSIFIFIAIGILIALSDQISSHLIKDTLVRRLRPSHEPLLQDLIHLSEAGRGGKYGFVSSHASNVFALTAFLILLLPKNYKYFKIILISCALLVSYSRIYNGVHYLSDVLAGGVLGIILGWTVWKLLIWISRNAK